MQFPPLNPRAYAVSQYVSAAAVAALVVSAPLQVAIAQMVPGALLFAVTGLLSRVMVWPLMLTMRATPPVTIDDAGITLTPRAGKTLVVPWEAVRDMKPYPLLPPADAETVRRAISGRKRYAAAEGLMLTSDALPWTYRAVGWFAGEGLRGAFAVTNRTHAGYAQAKYLLERRIKKMPGGAVPPQPNSHS